MLCLVLFFVSLVSCYFLLYVHLVYEFIININILYCGSIVANGCCQGFGTHFYSEMSSYEGEWQCGKRHGWGRMTYSDCSIYEGEWCEGKRCGQGMLRLRKLLFLGIAAIEVTS